ncbi:SPFH domain-containing protein [Portibacter marinus]|uniref:SPFH domain-containing protein n=1 Tax=Portibacter marinus TaxID=2898660 RepID=UPI001F231E9E|nr:SPFH domain-containing protein [Portibacter marinus]
MENIPFIYMVLAFIVFFLLVSGLFTVKQQTSAILERLGKFHSIKSPGLHFKIPLIDRVSGRVNLKIQQLDVLVETKTRDDVFVKMKVSVQYQILSDSIYEAFYRLESPTAQITSYVFDTVRAEVPKMKLDDVFVRKDDIAIAIRRELEEAMNTYGYGIIKALVTDIDPDLAVKNAMNRINASEREKTAAEYEGEAERIRIVAKAKAEAESKRLQGQGIADQRREIAKGLEDSVEVLNQVGINSQEASALIVITQHYDTLQSMGENVNSNLILLPNAPTAASDMLSQMVTSFVAANKMGEEMKALEEERERADKLKLPNQR